jgi:hypothetical protein
MVGKEVPVSKLEFFVAVETIAVFCEKLTHKKMQPLFGPFFDKFARNSSPPPFFRPH